MAGRYRQAFIGAWGARLLGGFFTGHAPSGVRANAAPAPALAPARDDRRGNRTAARVIAGCGRTPRSIPGGHMSTKKNFVGMTLAAVRAAVSRACCSFRRAR